MVVLVVSILTPVHIWGRHLQQAKTTSSTRKTEAWAWEDNSNTDHVWPGYPVHAGRCSIHLLPFVGADLLYWRHCTVIGAREDGDHTVCNWRYVHEAISQQALINSLIKCYDVSLARVHTSHLQGQIIGFRPTSQKHVSKIDHSLLPWLHMITCLLTLSWRSNRQTDCRETSASSVLQDSQCCREGTDCWCRVSSSDLSLLQSLADDSVQLKAL